ncbi:MAG: bifunctional 5,10-methylenetetrahydrofolate dehydrogenase/5,10-methenyltetrahydrofolate cyclohydrolase [Candidatus Buchananbacteria bacterium]|nr:bifunctional 5,10-methylenetetrahydrofolate dehydrogenase/5,10-methenyltetrahydrofolate cyclohydrolase [Candidatus Buchananbacteria bacterium]
MNTKSKKTAEIFDGKKLADEILLDLRKKIQLLPSRPGLAAVLIGEDLASHLYVNSKKKACQKVGIDFHEYLCGEKCYRDINQEGLLEMIDFLNNDPVVDGIIVQLPLPKEFDTQKIIERIDPKKDVDVFHPKNYEKFLTDDNQLTPPLIQAIQIALSQVRENLAGKQTLIVAKNEIFSQSLDKALEKNGLKTEVANPDDKDLLAKIKMADILISIVGQKHFIKATMIKPGAVVIDAGTVLGEDKKLFGSVDPKAEKVASFITPVPGGIGPLTVAALLKNIYKLANNKL